MNRKTKPILYSFRRCPYAMRARLMLYLAGISVELREVVLRDKPPSMLQVSPKGTVPILQLISGKIIDESLDLMEYAIDYGADVLPVTDAQNDLITENDQVFVHHLNRYKYSTWHNEADKLLHRDSALHFLDSLETKLTGQKWLYGDKPSKADYAILPFVRQFRLPDTVWFDGCEMPNIHRWLFSFMESTHFLACMKKYPQWTEGTSGVPFPNVS